MSQETLPDLLKSFPWLEDHFHIRGHALIVCDLATAAVERRDGTPPARLVEITQGRPISREGVYDLVENAVNNDKSRILGRPMRCVIIDAKTGQPDPNPISFNDFQISRDRILPHPVDIQAMVVIWRDPGDREDTDLTVVKINA